VIESNNKSIDNKTITPWKKNFLKIYIGQALSLLSSNAVQFAIIWWITVETGSALSLTVASVVGLLPQATIGIFAGVWIDRYPRKYVMIIADIIVAVSSFTLFVLFMFGLESIYIVYFILFIRAIGETFHKPALQAAIPSLVPKNELTKAAGLGQMINSATTMVGPMLGAFIMSITTLPFAMLVDVFGAFMAVISLITVKFPKNIKKQQLNPSVLQDLKAGLSAIRANSALFRLSIPMLISTIIFVPIGTLLPLMVKTFFNGTAWHNGLVQTLFSLGMLLSALMIGITGGMKRQFLMIAISTSLIGFSAIIGGILPSNLFWVFCIIVFVMGCCGMGFNIPFTAYVQRTIDDEHLGKVLSLITSVMSFAAPIGMFIAGPISEIIGMGNWMILAGLLMILTGIISYLLTQKHEKDYILVIAHHEK
jgi:DHA3 family macrolide efflux protein-like MFS transporter